MLRDQLKKLRESVFISPLKVSRCVTKMEMSND